MSEAEIKRRQSYKRNRKKWIIIQTVAIILLAVMALGSFYIYDRMNSTYYIEYTENGSVDYKVRYQKNSFFEEEWIGSGQSYVTYLIEEISADFKYVIDMDAENVGFDYSYDIEAQLIVSDKDTGDHLFAPKETLVPAVVRGLDSTDGFAVSDSVSIDFNKYNALAHQFVTVYGLKNATSMLTVSMNVEVISRCDAFESNNENNYVISLNIPLGEENFSISSSTSVSGEEGSKVLACKASVNQAIFLISGFISSAVVLILVIILILFVYITRNEDVDYTNKVKKLVNAYRSFIQQISGEFNTLGYQIVPIKTFVEMLGIRDTIQSPILMWENRDQTMTQFLIPTNTNMLYTFEIKVDNYDEIYGISDDFAAEDTVSDEHSTICDAMDDSIEAIVVDDGVDPDAVAEAMATPDLELSEIEYVEDDDEDYDSTEEHPGVEVVGVVWPEHEHKNKVYKYDPNGTQLSEGDMVLVPTRDASKDKDVIRKAVIAHANHVIDPDKHPHPLKKIIAVIKRHAYTALTLDREQDKE